MAIGLLAAGAGLMIWGEPSATQQYAAGCLRTGIILTVVWLALPDTRPLKNRLALAVVLIAALVLVVRPRLLLLVFSPPVLIVGVVLAVLLAFMRPRRSQNGPRMRRH
jgi:MFS superfamily sulfate permease-like transporter